MHRIRTSIFGFLLVLAAPVGAAESGLIERVQMGDNELDCAQIAAQVKDLDAILASHAGDQGAVRGATESAARTRTGDVVAGVAKVLPFGSVFGDIAKDVLGRRGREAEARVASARARKEYLVEMFLKRDCRMADVAKATAKSAPTAPAAQVAAPAEATPAAAAPMAEVAGATAGQAASPEKDASPPAPQSAPAQPAPALPAAEALPPPPAATSSDVSAPAAPQPPPAAAPRGPLFVLDFRLAFRTSADADSADGAPGLELGGVPLTTMQAITDGAYVALLKDLAQAGYEVLNPEIAAPLPGTGSLPAPARAGQYLYFAPSGAPLAQAPNAAQPGSDAALGETRTALAQAVAGRKPGVSYAIGVWYVDFARVAGNPGQDEPWRLETRLAVSAGSHLAIVEPGAETTPPDAVRILNLGRDLVTNEPYGQLRLSSGKDALRLQADPKRFTTLVERQLKRGRSALISTLPAPPPASETPPAQ